MVGVYYLWNQRSGRFRRRYSAHRRPIEATDLHVSTTKTVGYGRVSTASGEQLSALRSQLAWLEDQGCDAILSDVESGLNVARPSYTQLLQLLEARSVRVLYATRADRLGRDATELIRLVQLADQANVIVTTRDDGILSAKTAEELLLLFVRAALAQGESMKISARVVAGYEQGRSLGKPMRRPCWGYQLSDDRLRLEPHPELFPRARRLVEFLSHHEWRVKETRRSFPEDLPFSDSRGITCWLNNPTIRGALAYQRKNNKQYENIQWDRHPAVITHSEYAAYERQAAINRKNWGANSKKPTRPLTGLCVCGKCGSKLYYRNRTTTRLTLRCGRERGCSEAYKSIREEHIIHWAIDQLTTKAAEYLSGQTTQDEDPAAIELRRQIENLRSLQMAEVKPLIEQKETQLKSILNAPRADQETIRRISDKRLWDMASREELTETLHAVVKEITIHHQQPITLTWRF